MPFIPAAITTAIIGASGSVAGGLLAGRKSSEEKQALSAAAEKAQLETEAGQYGFGEAKKLLPKAETALEESAAYYRPMLAGDRQAMLEARAPEINTLLRQFRMATGRLLEEAPRSGARSGALAELPFTESGFITSLLQEARKEAAASTERIGVEQGALGRGLMPGDTGSASTLLNYALQNKEMGFTVGEKIGTGLADLLAKILGGGSSSTPVKIITGSKPQASWEQPANWNLE